MKTESVSTLLKHQQYKSVYTCPSVKQMTRNVGKYIASFVSYSAREATPSVTSHTVALLVLISVTATPKSIEGEYSFKCMSNHNPRI